MKYYCSLCFAKNPSIGTAGSPKPRPRLNSIPVMGQGYLFKVTQSTTATPVSASNPKALTAIFKCESCLFEIGNQEDLDEHIKSEHSFPCDHCNIKLKTSYELEKHIQAEHVIPCSKCDTMTISTEADMNIHMKACHELPCELCSTIFETVTELADHKIIAHSISCSHCNNTYTSQSDVDDHIDKCHKLPCRMCSETFIDAGQLLEHHNEEHKIKCGSCDASFTSKQNLEKHIQETHAIFCVECNQYFPVNTDMEQHKASNHVHVNILVDQKCRICDVGFTAIEDLKEHIELEHTLQCAKCQKKFRTNTEFNDHLAEHDTVKCTVCEVSTNSQEEMESHIKNNHSFPCPVCKTVFSSSKLVEEHMIRLHPFMCHICNKEESNSKIELEKHIEEWHTFTCDVCDYTGISEDSMENHILERHARPDADGDYKCDECHFKTKDKDNFGIHFKDVHGSKTRRNNAELVNFEPTNLQDDYSNLREENRILKNNFERLQAMYYDTQEETNKIKSEYETKLISANDKLERILSENEVLKEKVDVLFKLGRSYINNSNSNQKQVRSDIEETTDKVGPRDKEVEEIEVVSIDDENENLEDLQAWSVNKMRGFKRVNPAAQSYSNKSPLKNKTTRISKPSNQKETQETPSPNPHDESRPTSPHAESSNAASSNFQRKRYCHFFVNQGKCHYEERTGLKCKFEHKVAPMCSFGMRCTRPKCMYSHPKLATPNNFLGRNLPMLNPGPNIWQMMNPWLQSPNQFPPNPWISQEQNRSR